MCEVISLSAKCRERSAQAQRMAELCGETGNRAGYIDLIDVAGEYAWRANVYAPRRASVRVVSQTSFGIDPKGAA